MDSERMQYIRIGIIFNIAEEHVATLVADALSGLRAGTNHRGTKENDGGLLQSPIGAAEVLKHEWRQ